MAASGGSAGALETGLNFRHTQELGKRAENEGKGEDGAGRGWLCEALEQFLPVKGVKRT